MGKQETNERILEGVIRALGRNGRHFSLREVCDEAHVSRATLSRYYPSKDGLLSSAARYLERDLAGVVQAAAEQVAPGERVRAVLKAMMGYPNIRPAYAQLLTVEPGFVLEFIAQEMPNFTRTVCKALAPDLADHPAVQQGLLSEGDLAELLVRLTSSAFLSPSPRAARLPEHIASLLHTPSAPAPGALRVTGT
jgi:AcrR family transcriptional regulator